MAEVAVAHPFEDLAQQKEAAGLAMWTFLATEVMLFGGLFAAFTYYLVQFRHGFHQASHHLYPWIATANTAVLLTSSVLVALAVHAADEGAARRLARLLSAAAALGALFLALKGYEYFLDYQGGVLPAVHFTAAHFERPAQARLFFVFYWAMTGLHAVHMTVGVGVLVTLAALARRGRFDARPHPPVVMGGLYWHFVDVVWVFLYPLLYLVP